MARIAYEDWAPRGEALALLDLVNGVCEEYAQQRYDLTLRQVYYQMVARGYIPNNDRSYKNLGNVINKGRLGGYLDWDHIVDRTRNLRGLSHFDAPTDVINAARWSYRNDKWQHQDTRVEVWVEKEALAGVVERVAARHDVDWFSCRGYVSQSEVWSAAKRLRQYIEGGQNVVVLHLGDHDPSGIDMTRDITDRLTQFIGADHAREPFGYSDLDVVDDHSRESAWDMLVETVNEKRSERFEARNGRMPDPYSEDDWDGVFFGQALEIRRIALNMDQVRTYNPPPNPAKITDSRAKHYIERFGEESWELDALDPRTLDALIEQHILGERDVDRWDEAKAREDHDIELLKATTRHWHEVAEYIKARGFVV